MKHIEELEENLAELNKDLYNLYSILEELYNEELYEEIYEEKE